MSKTKIIESTKSLDLASIKELVGAKPSLLNVADRSGRKLLHIACAVSCKQLGVPNAEAARVVAFLLDRGMPIDEPFGKDACTPLFEAVARGRNPTVVRFLLKRGADVNAAPGGGLFAAAWWDDLENLKHLVNAGAQIDIVVGITPFLAAWLWRKYDSAKFLATKGANVNYQDRKGKTALHHGIEKEFPPEMLKWLVKHGASPDIEDREGVTARAKASRKRDKKFLAALDSR